MSKGKCREAILRCLESLYPQSTPASTSSNPEPNQPTITPRHEIATRAHYRWGASAHYDEGACEDYSTNHRPGAKAQE